MTYVSPPVWAETLLRTLLGREDGETVAGDLVEEYRDCVYLSRGQSRADWWFIRQVGGFAWRATWFWAVLFAALWLAREALDWFVPTTDFVMRSKFSTYSAVGIFIALGCRRGWRTRSLRASAFAAFLTGALAAVFKTIGTAAMFALWHDAGTRMAIVQSGGLSEAFELPWMVIIPAIVFAIAGGILGKIAATLFRPKVSNS
jgi:hypothetical protein